MKHDIFFSICQTPVDGFMPDERGMLTRFFNQARLADDLGFGVAWVAETHLSCQIQKRLPRAVIPAFEGEIGLNVDTLQLAHILFAQTKRIGVGSAIRNILCNGGPIAQAEAVRMFLSLHSLQSSGSEARKLDLGFAAGRFPFSSEPYGIKPRNQVEALAWPALRGLIFKEAAEIFLRFIRGDVLASRDVAKKILRRESLRAENEWHAVLAAADALAKSGGDSSPRRLASDADAIEIPSFWNFDEVGVVPMESPLELLRLTIGSHDASAQILANTIMPCGVFNLSIAPAEQIEATHRLMEKSFHPSGGAWTRDRMPRTALIFIDDSPQGGAAGQKSRARVRAKRAMTSYWQAMEGTLDLSRIEQAVDNSLVGGPEEIAEIMRERFHPDDRLMLWFDYFNHDDEHVQRSMCAYIEKVAPLLP